MDALKNIFKFIEAVAYILAGLFVIIVIINLIKSLIIFLRSQPIPAGLIGLMITAFVAHKTKQKKDSPKFNKYKIITIVLLIFSIISFLLPKGPSIKEYEEAQEAKKSRIEEEKK